jgi:pilus assembly protein Flp/PilA
MTKLIPNLIRDKKGAALVEYGLLVAGVALVATAGVSILGHKTSDLVSAVAAVLPGAHEDDNGAIASGKLIETTSAEDGSIAVDTEQIATNTATPRLGNNLGMENLGADLVVEAD